MLRLVDTNVVCAGLISRDPEAPTVRIVEAMLAGTFRHAVTLPLVREYERVLRRDALRRLHRLQDAELERLVIALVKPAAVLTPGASPLQAPDPGDQFLWDALAAHPPLQLVTGDRRLLQSDHWPGRVLSPAQVWSAAPDR